MIVLIDIEAGKITICDKIVKIFTLDRINEVIEILREKEVYYVTAAEIVSGNQVINLISDLARTIPQAAIAPSHLQKPPRQYVHATKMSSPIVHSDQEDGSNPVMFEGAGDCKPIESISLDIMDSQQMHQYMKAGLIEIIDDVRRLEVLADISEKRKKFEKLNAERDTGSTIVPDYEVGTAERMAREGIMAGEDIAKEISVSGSTSFKREDEQELFRNLDELGIELE